MKNRLTSKISRPLTTALIAGIACLSFAGEKSLYERMGGIHKIAQFMDRSVELESMDKSLEKNPRIAQVHAMNSKPAIKFLLTSWAAAGIGGPQVYKGPDIASIEIWLKMSKKETETCWKHRMQAMTEAGIDKSLLMEFRKWDEMNLMKAKQMGVKGNLPMAEPFEKMESLYARLGGIMAISAVVDDFVNRLATDKTVLANANVVKSLTSGKVSGAGLKFLVTEQLAAASGGPWKYSGRSMADSHKGLMISEKEWEATAKLLKMSLDKFIVPMKEQNEVFAAIAATHGDIVGK